jgi:hypothetical protein
MRYVVVKTRFRGMSPGFPPNFGGDYGKVTVIVFTALAWRLLKSHFSVMFPRRGMHRGESRGVNKERSRYFDFARAGSKHYRFVDDRRMIRSYLI